MKKMSSNEVRKKWIDFFVSKNHHFLEPVSLVPVDDPSLLWINSGVATLKPYFDGRKNPPAFRLTNSQKSIRTNDIENVGITARHQTMFEMLGNFSIGDYFKAEAIHFAWELLTSPEWFEIDKEKLYITVFEEDEDAYNIWTKEIGIKPDHIFKGNKNTNFWDVGQGPCGPNTEIFFDRGPEWDPENIGSRLLKDDIENDRFIEIWNIVFSQFNNDGKNNYSELPRKNIDTGAGLERIVSIFQNAPTNFETDLFLPTIHHLQNLVNNKDLNYNFENYTKLPIDKLQINTCYKVIADHIRAATFAIADGVFPSNKDRGYIIRRLIRRSVVYGKRLGINKQFLYLLVDDVIKSMGDFYNYLQNKRDLVIEAIKDEEERFLKTLNKGYEILEKLIETEKQITAKNVLLMFESYGFPLELVTEIAGEKNIKVDIEGYKTLLENVKEISRKSRKNDKVWNKQSAILTNLDVKSEFVGYDVESTEAIVNYLFWDDKELHISNGQEVFVVLDKTPFYAEKGGQAGDIGNLYINKNDILTVIDTQQGPNHQNIHRVILNNNILKVGDRVLAEINKEKRHYTMKNHSGTHILHAAVREVLGESAMQAGSYNDENGLRIDISYKKSITSDQVFKIQQIVEQQIKNALPCEVYNCSMDDAINKYNALAFFAEKYDSIVRVIKFGNFSSELCGGTHVNNTKDIEDLLITNVESKGSGVFRFSALTSFKTISDYLNKEFVKMKSEISNFISKYNLYKNDLLSKDLNSSYNEIMSLSTTKENLNILKQKIVEFKDIFKNYSKDLKEILIKKAVKKYLDLQPINDEIKCSVELSIEEMKYLADILKNKFKNLVVILFNEKAKIIMVTVSEQLLKTKSAINILKNIKDFNIKGGGNDSLAQGKII